MSYVISVCTPFRMYHGGYHWMNFHESWKVGTSIKVWRRTQFLFFNIGQKIGQVTGSPDTLYCCQRGRLHEAQTLCIVVNGAGYMKPRHFVLLSATTILRESTLLQQTVFLYFWQCRVYQQRTWKAFSPLHDNNDYSNAPSFGKTCCFHLLPNLRRLLELLPKQLHFFLSQHPCRMTNLQTIFTITIKCTVELFKYA